MSAAAAIVATGVLTAVAGIGAALLPRTILRFVFNVADAEGPLLFFVRHWGVLIALVGALTAAGGAARPEGAPVLLAAATEKLAGGGLVFFGPVKRTAAMTAVALIDAAFAIFYLAYITGH